MATPNARHVYAASPVSVPPASPSPSKSRFFSIPRSSSPRPSQLSGQLQQSAMGHNQSAMSGRPQTPPLPPTPASELPLNSHAQNAKPKFVWPGRRKKSEDMGRLLGRGTPSPPVGRGELGRSDVYVSDYESPGSSTSNELPLERTQSRQTSAKAITIHLANVLKGKILSPSSSSFSSPRTPSFPPNIATPPPLPPKTDTDRSSMSGQSRSSAESAAFFNLTSDKRVSMQKPLPPTTPPAILMSQPQPQVTQPPQSDSEFRNDHHTPGTFIPATPILLQHRDDVKTLGPALIHGQAEVEGSDVPRRREKREDIEAQTAREIVEDWRKSDSTLRTVRLVGQGQRTPRPLSLAESTTSNQTVLPGAGSPAASAGLNATKRNSLLVDADFGPLEVESEESDDDDDEVLYLRDDYNIPGAQQSWGQTASVESVNSKSAPPSAWQSATRSRSPSPPSSAPANKGSRRGSISFRLGRFSSSPSGDRTPASAPIDHLSGSDSEAMSSLSASTHSHTRTPSSSTTSVSVSSSSPSSAMIKDPVVTPTVGIVSSSTSMSTGSDFWHGIPGAQQQQQQQFEWAAKEQASRSQTSLSTSNSSHGRHPSQDTPYSPGSESESIHSQTFSGMSHATQASYPAPPNTMRPAQQRSRLASINSKGFRQTAVSLTSGLAPAAGFAKGFGKRIGRALGGSVTNVSTIPPSDSEMYGQGHGHSQSTIMGRSQSTVEQHVQSQGFFGMGQRQGPPTPKKIKGKHASNASASTHSRPSFSDSDAAPRIYGPNLGKLVRPPPGGPGTGGLVFGRDLALCVRDTAVGVGVPGWESHVKKQRNSTFSMDMEVVGAKALEGRKLPALVMRCAQHLEKWGIQEEGLFR